MSEFLYKHKLLSAAVVIWAMGLITWVVHVGFTTPPDIPGGTASVILGVVGLFATAAAVWMWRNGGE